MDKLNKRIKEVTEEGKSWRKSVTSYKRCEVCNDFLPQTEMNRCQNILDALELGKQAVEEETKELKQMYELRNDDAKDYSKRITELENERQEILEKIKEFTKRPQACGQDSITTIKMSGKKQGYKEIIEFLEKLNSEQRQ